MADCAANALLRPHEWVRLQVLNGGAVTPELVQGCPDLFRVQKGKKKHPQKTFLGKEMTPK